MAKARARHQAAEMALPAGARGGVAERVVDAIVSAIQRLERQKKSKEVIAAATAFMLFVGGLIVTEDLYPMGPFSLPERRAPRRKRKG